MNWSVLNPPQRRVSQKHENPARKEIAAGSQQHFRSASPSPATMPLRVDSDPAGSQHLPSQTRTHLCLENRCTVGFRKRLCVSRCRSVRCSHLKGVVWCCDERGEEREGAFRVCRFRADNWVTGQGFECMVLCRGARSDCLVLPSLLTRPQWHLGSRAVIGLIVKFHWQQSQKRSSHDEWEAYAEARSQRMYFLCLCNAFIPAWKGFGYAKGNTHEYNTGGEMIIGFKYLIRASFEDGD